MPFASRPLWAVLALLSLLCTPAQALRVDGMEFDDRLRLGGQELQLNGVGFRSVATFKGYAAALYLAERVATPAEVTALPGAKRLQMRMLMDVPAAEFSKALRKGVRRNTPAAERPGLEERLARFDAVVLGLGTVRKGDVVDLDFVPERGLTLALNGRQRGEAIAGADLYAALLRVFVGQRVSDADLKLGLLGARVPQ